MEGHEKGVNCVDYYTGGDKPYLISGADDRLCKIWDYQVSQVTEIDYLLKFVKVLNFCVSVLNDFLGPRSLGKVI